MIGTSSGILRSDGTSRWSWCACEMSTASRFSTVSGGGNGAIRRMYAMRSRSIGSVSTRVPSSSIKAVACPTYVTPLMRRPSQITIQPSSSRTSHRPQPAPAVEQRAARGGVVLVAVPRALEHVALPRPVVAHVRRRRLPRAAGRRTAARPGAGSGRRRPAAHPRGCAATTIGCESSVAPTICPGASSSAAHDPHADRHRQPPVGRARVVEEDLARQVLGQTGRQRLERRVEVPVRVVGREADQLVGAHLADQRLELARASSRPSAGWRSAAARG